MKQRREWMNSATESTLELLDEDVVINVIGMKRTFDLRAKLAEGDDMDEIGESTIRRAVEPLEEHGFIEQVGEKGTYYQITETGRSYLRGAKPTRA